MRVLINCALPYANSSLHLGHIAGAYLGGDIFARYNRMVGNQVLFVCGSDEYGTPITIRADREKVPPKQIVDLYHEEQDRNFKDLDIDFDIFSRTTYREHADLVQSIFLELMKKGYIEEKTTLAPYCEEDRRFLPDRYVTGTCPYCGNPSARGDQCDECGRTLDAQELKDPLCILSNTTPVFKETKHLFFRLSLFQEKLSQWVESHREWRNSVLQFSMGFLFSGLKDRPITRDIQWGVPVPVEGYGDKRIYVWIEALMGYISAAMIYSKKVGAPDYWQKFWREEARTYYFMGKDNITFHSIILPAILMALGEYNLPDYIAANENMNMEGKKFSKSRQIGLTVNEVLRVASKDYIRYYIASVLPETGDTDFSMEDFQEKVNSELIAKYGNLVHRLTSFASANALVLRTPLQPDQSDSALLSRCEESLNTYLGHLEKIEIKKALRMWIDLVQTTNAYFNEAAPWRLLKVDREKCIDKLSCIYRACQYLTVMAYPLIPSASNRIWKDLQGEGSIESSGLSKLKASFTGVILKRSEPPFEKFAIESTNPNTLDLRVGKILSVAEHENASKLYLLTVDLGERKINLVAGLREKYRPEDLTGRKIVVVANLKKAKIRGHESQGMLLAADDGQNTRFLTVPDDVPAGSPVDIGEFRFNGKEMVEIDDLAAFKLGIRKSGEGLAATAELEGSMLTLNVRGRTVYPERDVAEGARIR